ncbi:MAG: universal stress protein [Kiritimatiellae bacterium]|nr:universal stress protein [Kiritimatiellia bacterium]
MTTASAPAPADSAPAPFHHVLYCTDFSENADRAFPYALRAATRNPGATLHLLHVIPEPSAQFWKGYIYDLDEDVDAMARREIDQKLADAYRPRLPDDLPFVTAMRIGEAAQKILEYAAEAHIDLIVIGRQGAGAGTRLLFGNITGRVTRRAPCPVLVVP